MIAAERRLLRIFLVIGVALASLGALFVARQDIAIRDAKRVDAVVETSTYENDRLALSYRWDGGTSSRVYPGPAPLHSNRTLAERFPAGTRTTAYVGKNGAFLLPHRAFSPSLLLLAALPFFLGASAVSVGLLRFAPSGQPDFAPATKLGDGWFAVRPLRSNRAYRDASTWATGLLLGFGAIAFGHHFALARPVDPLAVLFLIPWTLLTLRLGWIAMRTRSAATKVGDVEAAIRPGDVAPGAPLAVRVRQPVLRDLEVRGVDIALVAMRVTRTDRGAHRRPRYKTTQKLVHRERREAAGARSLGAGSAIEGETVFQTPPLEDAADVRHVWWLYVRTRLAGLDYHTRIPLAGTSASAPTQP